jgi:hypothetical protein
VAGHYAISDSCPLKKHLRSSPKPTNQPSPQATTEHPNPPSA